MLYPVTPQEPKDTLMTLMYKTEISGNKHNNNDVYIYSYKAYDYDGNLIMALNETDDKTDMATIDLDHCYVNELNIVIDVDHDNVDYAKFIISDVTLRLLLNSLSGHAHTRIKCYVVGHRFTREWKLFCIKYNRFKQQMINMRTTNQNELWHKYFMYNTRSRTPEYLNIVECFDKKLASLLLPHYIEAIPSLSIDCARNPNCFNLFERDMFDTLGTNVSLYYTDEQTFNELNDSITSTYDDI